MIGSTIVFIPELPQDLSNLVVRIVENEEFEKIGLDCLTSLDFAIITKESNTKWDSEKNPIIFDEDSGLAIIHISKKGLASVIQFKGELENIANMLLHKDIAKIKEFSEKYGSENLYELTTF